jgi:two-component system LytT family response regulator
MIRAVIIDDEPLAIDALTILLQRKCKEDVQVVATSNSPKLGRELIEKHRPDLVFVDVEMPGMSGIDLIHSFRDPTFRVVFVTAFDAYAIEALRLSAIDYLLKPVESDEIQRVITKVKADIRKNESDFSVQMQNLEKLLSQNTSIKESRIGIGMADKIVFVDIIKILYCIADGAYTIVYLNDGKKIVASRSLGEFEQQLAAHDFFRIHHSNLVNLRHVKEFQKFNGGYVIMDNNEKLEVSHRKKNDFLKALDEFVV